MCCVRKRRQVEHYRSYLNYEIIIVALLKLLSKIQKVKSYRWCVPAQVCISASLRGGSSGRFRWCHLSWDHKANCRDADAYRLCASASIAVFCFIVQIKLFKCFLRSGYVHHKKISLDSGCWFDSEIDCWADRPPIHCLITLLVTHVKFSFSLCWWCNSVSLPRFPFYFELKIAFVIWLLSPYTKGSSVLYRKFVHPTLSNKERVGT